MAILTLSLRRWRPLPVALFAMALAVSWNLTPLAASFAKTSGDPAADPAYWTPAVQFLRTHLSPSYRVEAVDTVGHWPAAYLPAAGIPIVRGWFRQNDFPRNDVLYGDLDRTRYVAWLRSLGVRYVVLPDAPLDYSAKAEGALIVGGRSSLRVAFRSAHTTIFAVPSPRRIVTGPGMRASSRSSRTASRSPSAAPAATASRRTGRPTGRPARAVSRRLATERCW